MTMRCPDVIPHVGCEQRILDRICRTNDRIERAVDRIALVSTEPVVGEGEPQQPCGGVKPGAAVKPGESEVTVAGAQVRFRLHVASTWQTRLQPLDAQPGLLEARVGERFGVVVRLYLVESSAVEETPHSNTAYPFTSASKP